MKTFKSILPTHSFLKTIFSEKIKLYTILTAILGLSLPTPFYAKTTIPDEITFVTYNIRNGRGMDNRTDYKRVAEEIIRSKADLVALQEIDSCTARSQHRYVLGELAFECRMYPVFGRAIKINKGNYGVGLLSKERPIGVKNVALPGKEERRTLLIVEFPNYYAICTHFSLTEKDRIESVKILNHELSLLKAKPVFLAGDLNATPDSPEIKALAENFHIVNNPKAFTFPADKPDRTIDYIGIWKATADQCYWNPSAVRVLNAPLASDHRPIRATFRFKQPAEDFFYGAPYLQNPTENTISILFQTYRPSHCWIEYTTDSLLLTNPSSLSSGLHRAQTLIGGQAVCHDIEQKILLDSLEAGQRYYYRVGARELLENRSYYKAFGDTVYSNIYSFTLPDKNTENLAALIFNDTHCVRELEERLAQTAARIPHDFTVFNGDCLPEPSTREEAINNINRVAQLFDGASRPIFFVRGNHEIRNAYSSGMPSLFDYPGGVPGRPYGAFSWGDTRFVLLDCGEDKPDNHWVYYGLNDFARFRQEQAEFLREEIKSRPFRKANRRIVMSHIPIWGNTDDYQPCPPLWAPWLEKGCFDLGIFGHTHHWRFYAPGEINDNPFPVYIGGGYETKGATIALLRKEEDRLTLTIMDCDGATLKTIELE